MKLYATFRTKKKFARSAYFSQSEARASRKSRSPSFSLAGPDPLVVIRRRDIFLRLELAAIDSTETSSVS
jgi:hypothetical protein